MKHTEENQMEYNMVTASGEKILPRILRDITDGVLVLDRGGNILYINPSGCQILGLTKDCVGQKYYAVAMDDEKDDNDKFHQFLLDAVYDKDNTHSGEIEYTDKSGKKRNLRIVTSFLRNAEGNAKDGVVIQFSDETEVVRLRRKEHDTVTVFAVTMILVCSWIFFVQIWEYLNRPIPLFVMTNLVEIIGILLLLFILKNTSFTWQDIGLSVKGIGPIIRLDSLMAALGAVLLILVKVAMLKANPGHFEAGTPFFDWKVLLRTSSILYPFTAILQEFLVRGVVHENMRRIFTGKRGETLAIVVSSLFFGALHLYLGLMFMAGAALLLGVLGVLYRRQNTIWGLCIPHFVLGLMLSILHLG